MTRKNKIEKLVNLLNLEDVTCFMLEKNDLVDITKEAIGEVNNNSENRIRNRVINSISE